MRGGKKVVIEKHRLDGVYIARGKEDALCTRNLVPGDSVYGEKRISVDVRNLYHSPFFNFSVPSLRGPFSAEIA